MKRISLLKILAPLLFFLVIYSCRPAGPEEEASEEAFGATPVKVVKVKRQKISEKLVSTGVIEPWRKVNITPDIGGKIAKIYVDEGDRVEEGQLLAELDTRSVLLQLEQAKAGLAVAEANFKDAKRNMERMERLIGEKAVSDQQYEKVKLAYEAAEAQLQQAETSLNLARYQLDVSLMKAPFSGVVASRNAEVGDVINPMMGGFSPLSGVLTLMDFSRVKINLGLSQQDMVRVKKDQVAYLTVSAFPGRRFEGRVSLVSMTADPMSKKFRVEVTVDNPHLLLRPNTFGEVTLEVSTNPRAIVIPQKAVLDNSYVFLAQGSKARKVEIVLGLQNSSLVEVVRGLEEGDLVIVEGNYGLEDGAEIEVKEILE